jgi:DNA-binding PadR family transcriptional regulator
MSKLSFAAAAILQSIGSGAAYGFSIMEATGLPSGTVYPALRRLEAAELIKAHWEKQSLADKEQRPPRRYYTITRSGRAALDAARQRYPLLVSV